MIKANYIFVLGIISCLALSACDNSLDPFAEAESNFGIYGFLDASADTQFVRIEGRRGSAEGSSQVLGKLISTELGSNNEVVWNDSSNVLNNGEVGSLFWTTAEFQSGKSYQIQAIEGGRVDTEVEVSIPADPSFSTDQPFRSFNNNDWRQIVRLQNVEGIPNGIQIRMTASYPNGELFEKDFEYGQFFIRDSGNNSPASIQVRIESNLDDIRTSGGFADQTINFHEARLVIRLRNSEWIDSGTGPSNVSSGFGFVGSIMTFEHTWPIDGDILEEQNYTDRQ